MSLPAIKNVLSLYHSHLSQWLLIFISLDHHHWSWQSSFDSWYLSHLFFGMYLTFAEAVILILKHATFLRHLNLSPESALTLAELDYQEANVDLTIQQHLMASSQEHSVELFVAFVMATEIGLFIFSSACTVSHQSLVHVDQDVDRKKGHWFKQLFLR